MSAEHMSVNHRPMILVQRASNLDIGPLWRAAGRYWVSPARYLSVIDVRAAADIRDDVAMYLCQK